jgi:hypothetical protein
MTKEERAFAEQWNQWVAAHPEEMDALRTRGIADNMTEEQTTRELLALMVRFSRESQLQIPQHFIDDIKNEAVLAKEK